MVMDEISVRDPRRSAHATIRGYLYQVCLGVLRWLDLAPNELLLLEGDEDLDRILRGERSCEQVKYRSHDLSLGDPAVTRSLVVFMTAFAELSAAGEQRRFIFTSNAAVIARDAELVEGWREPERRSDVIAAVRDAVGDEAGDAIEWLDSSDGRWSSFIEAVEWRFETGSVDDLMTGISDRLRQGPQTRLLDCDLLADRLVVAVLQASTGDTPGLRLLDRGDLDRVVETTAGELYRWARSPAANGLCTVRQELRDLSRLLQPRARPRPAGMDNPASLLRAEYQVVRFFEPGRLDLLQRLAEWCDSAAVANVQLLYGAGGFGKTRLLIEWCQRLARQGWFAGFLERGSTATEPLFSGATPRLCVVDYAETRLPEVTALLRGMCRLDPDQGPKLRVVLLARDPADWWDQLRRDDFDFGELLAGSPQPVPVPALEARAELFDLSLTAFAAALDKELPAGPGPDLDLPLFARTLYLQMAALAAVRGKVIEKADLLLDATIEHERRFWTREIESLGLDRSTAALVKGAMRRIAAALTLTGGASTQQRAEQLAAAVSQHLTPPQLISVVTLLQRLYPGNEQEVRRWTAGVEPDLLGEHLVAREADAELLDSLLEIADADEIRQSLTILTRLAARSSTHQDLLADLLARRLEQLAGPALAVAVETGDPIGLREVKVTVVQKRLDDQRTEATDEAGLKELARLANNLGKMLSDLGQREPALAASQEAVDIRRQLAAERPDAFLPVLATSLNNLGNRLSDLGRREPAFDATQEAVDIRRQLAVERPDAFLPDFAMSLNNLGKMLSDLGRREPALDATQEAVDIRRQLAAERPDAFLPDLATSLNNLGNMLSDLGRREPALDATQEAVDIRRQLAEERPDAFLPDLARSLNNLGNRLSDLGRREPALAASQEAVDIRRQLAAERPDAFLPDLATSLNNLGLMLSALGRREPALDAIQEAVDIRRQLAAERPDAFLPDLANSLNNMGRRLAEMERDDEALAAAHEAVIILAPFFLALPAAHARRMSYMVDDYLARAAAAGHDPDSDLVDPIRQALAQLGD
jgi:tetratricopeptide (TPR) repeat protein